MVKWSFREGLEGSRLYKIGEYYYIYSTYGGWPAFQTVFRSKDIYGPYEEKKLIDDDNIHQGALVETQTESGGLCFSMIKVLMDDSLTCNP